MQCLRFIVIATLALLGAPVAAEADAFGPGPGTTVSGPPGAIADDNFNNLDDGTRDLAVAGGDGSVRILLGHGNGTFTPTGAPIQAGASASAITSGDFNGDGKPDLAVADYTSASVVILLGDGHGGFTPATGSPVSVPASPDALFAGGFITSKPDVVAVGTLTGVVLVGQTTPGHFAQLPGTIPAPGDITGVAGGYFTGSGHLSLAALDGTTDKVSVLLGAGTGNFTPATGSPFSTGVSNDPGLSLVAGGFNSTGPVGLDVAAGFEDGRVSVLLGDGTGKLALAPGSPFQATGGTQAIALAAGNFNSAVTGSTDGLAVAGYFQGGCLAPCSVPADTVAVLEPTGTGAMTEATGSPYSLSGVTTGVTADDYNGDGLEDVAFSDGFSCHGHQVLTLLSGAARPPSTHYGGDGCPIAKPGVVTGDSSDVSLTAVTVHGEVDPNFQRVTDCRFQYGIGNFNQSKACTETRGTRFLDVSARLTGLTGLRVYQYRLVASSPGGQTVDSHPRKFETCDTTEVTFGVVDARGCFTYDKHDSVVGSGKESHHTIFDGHGAIDVNGVIYSPDPGGGTVIDEPGSSLHIQGQGDASGGSRIPLLHWGHDMTVPLSAKPRTLFAVNKDTSKALHFPISGSLTGALVKAKSADGKTDLYGTQLTASASLKPIGDPGTASVTLTTYAGLGPRGLKISAQPANADPRFGAWDPCNPGAKYAGYKCVTNKSDDHLPGSHLEAIDPRIIHLGPFQVTDFVGSFDFATHEWQIEAGLAIGTVMPGPLNKVLPTLSLGGTFGPNGLESFHAGDSNLDWSVGPFQIQGITFDLTFQPHFGIGGQISANILRDVEFLKKLHLDQGASINGGFKFALGNSGFDIRINGPVPLFGLPIDGYVEFDNRDDALKLLLGGSFSKDFGPASVNVNVDGAVQIHPSVHLQLGGDGTAQAFGLSLGVHALLTDSGIGACGQVSAFGFSQEIGFKHFWAPFPGGETDVQGCDFSGLYTISSGARDAAVGQTVIVAPRTTRKEIAAVGVSGPPSVTLTGPHGEQLSTPAQPNHFQVSRLGLALAVTSSRTTYFFLQHPTAGRWRISPAAGAASPLRYELAAPLAPVDIRALVSGTATRRTLRWKLHAQRGQSVQFIQRGGREQGILTTSRAAGHIPFTVAPGPRGRRTVLAVVSIDGIARQRLTVARFSAPPPTGPRASHVRLSLRRGRLTVSWRRARGATAYLLTVSLRHGSLRYRLGGRSSSARVALPAGAQPKSVSVTGVDASGLRGHPASAKFPRAHGRHKRHKRH